MTKPEVRKKVVNLDKQLVAEINHHFGYVDARCVPRKLWEVEKGPARYRINWFDWESNDIIKSVFCHIEDVNPARPESPDKDYEPDYKIT